MPRSGSMLEAEFEGEWAAARERVLQLWATERESSTRGVEASRAVVIERSGLPKAWVERMLKSEVPPNRPGRPEALKQTRRSSSPISSTKLRPTPTRSTWLSSSSVPARLILLLVSTDS